MKLYAFTRIYWKIFLLLFGCGYLLAFALHSLEAHLTFLEAFKATGALLTTQSGSHTPSIADMLAYKIANFLTKAGLLILLIGGLWHLSYQRYVSRRISTLKDHSIICGYGAAGRAFVANEAKTKRPFLIIADTLSDGDKASFNFRNWLFLEGDFRDVAMLQLAGIKQAEQIIIVSGEDTVNLESLHVVREILAEETWRTRQIHIYVEITQSIYWQKVTQDNMVYSEQDFAIVSPFNRETMIARHFVWTHPLYTYAELLGQKRIHCVFWGFDTLSEALISRIATSFLYKNFDKIAITVIDTDIIRVEHHIKARFGELDRMVDFSYLNFDWQSDYVDTHFLSRINQSGAATACFYTAPDDDQTMQKALSVKDALIQLGQDHMPHFVPMKRSKGFEKLFTNPEDTLHIGDIFCTLGSDAAVYNISMIDGALERSAKRLHNQYREHTKNSFQIEEQWMKRDSLSGWHSLSDTLKESNRRAVDHIPAKMASAGCYWPEGPSLTVDPAFSMGSEKPDQMERLAKLEQKSWSAGRYVDGWRPGDVRDYKRKVHELLGYQYEELDHAIQEYDRQQVSTIDTMVLKHDSEASGRGLYDHRIGLIGHNKLSEDEATWARDAFVGQVLPKLVKDNPGTIFTLVTPLAPGSDTLLAESAISYLCETNIPFRLIVLEMVPEDDMLRDFQPAFEAGGHFGYDLSHTALPFMDPARDSDGFRLLKEKRAAFIAENCRWHMKLYDLDIDFSAEPNRVAGYDIAASYMADQCNSLIAISRADAANRKGGTLATLENRKAGYAKSPLPWHNGGNSQSIILQTTDQKVIEEVLEV